VTYLKLTIAIPDPYQENLIAELLELDFEGFEQFDDRLEAFIPKPRFSDVSREYIEQVLAVYPVESFILSEEIKEKNWNEEWEHTIRPQTIGQFFVKPSWSAAKPPKGKTLLEIDPKMSFGTGYHATTRLMLQGLPSLKPAGKTVLDAGTGTGILAIAALKLGAENVFAFDIDNWSETNARENALINQVDDRIVFAHGGFETIPVNALYEIVLANINRNVILAMLEILSGHLAPGGSLCVTGILHEDVQMVENKAYGFSLHPEERRDKDDWSWLHLKRKE